MVPSEPTGSAREEDLRAELDRARSRERAVLGALERTAGAASLLGHEIKNAVSAVHLALRAVARELGEDEEEVLADLVRRLRDVELALRRILGFATPLEVRPQPVALAKAVDAALAEARRAEGAGGVAVEVGIDPGCPDVAGDPGTLVEALAHLVRNAFQVLPQGGRVVVRAAPEAATGFVRLCVDDDGPGIPDSLAGRLFEPFVTGRPDGSGLGLATCRKIAAAHGGTIDVEASELGGACFRMRLPAASA